MKLHYCVPTRNRFDLARAGIAAALAGSLVPDRVVVLDNSDRAEAAGHLADLVTAGVEVVPQRGNLGVSASWNWFLRHLEDHVVIANDDAVPGPETCRALVGAAQADTTEVFFGVTGDDGNAFSIFLLRKRGWQRIGPFEEAFYPAYYEDDDYAHRLRLAGYRVVRVPGATFEHLGSATYQAYKAEQQEQHRRAVRVNRRRYLAKWGGLPGNERFSTPYGT